MALLCQVYRLLVNLPNFSSCFSNFIKSFIHIFETSVECICCEIIFADDTASGEDVRYKRLLSGYIYQRCTGTGFQDSNLEGFSTFSTNRIGSGLQFFSSFRIRILKFHFWNLTPTQAGRVYCRPVQGTSPPT